LKKKINYQVIKNYSNKLKKIILKSSFECGESVHIGGALSIVEIVSTLFFGVMKINKEDPKDENRDRFILSKGHGVLAYYAALNLVGFIPDDELKKFEKTDSFLFGHPVMNRDKGIEFSNGSLGMGLSLGIGVALATKINKKNCNVYVLMGDGECNEGSVWEGAMAGAQFDLNNLVAIIDRNNLQQTGSNDEIMSLGDVASKWKSFGWEVVEIDGHNISEIYSTLIKAKKFNGPFAIIAHTIKGKGFSFAENNNVWHHAPMTKSQYEEALLELEGKNG